MQLNWSALDAAPDGALVEIDGWFVAAPATGRDDYFILTDEAACCAGHLPADPRRRIEVFAATPFARPGEHVQLAGRWHCLRGDAAGWLYQLHEARPCHGVDPAALHPGFTRRGLLAASGALGLAAFMPVAARAEGGGPFLNEARAALADAATVDVHSHAGRVIAWREGSGPPFEPFAGAMRGGGLALACLAMVADAPLTRVTADRRIEAFRPPNPGELFFYAERAFSRALGLVASEGLHIVDSVADLQAARAARPGVIISAEGADFLEGKLERVDEARRRWKLRHLQLTHYRANELGDIQTEAPVHGGLTDFGAEVVRRCNALGIVVDVAHGPFTLVKRAAEVSSKPLVLSHTSLSRSPSATSRLISADHAKLIAQTGGVIGIWPVKGIFADITAMAEGIGRMVDVVGVDHVGVGTDMLGLPGGSVVPDYTAWAYLAAALLARGFNADEMRKIMGGNYGRVFAATLS